MAEVGVDRIEAGMPAVSPDDYKAIKEICSLGLDSKNLHLRRAMESTLTLRSSVVLMASSLKYPLAIKTKIPVRLDMGRCLQEISANHQV